MAIKDFVGPYLTGITCDAIADEVVKAVEAQIRAEIYAETGNERFLIAGIADDGEVTLEPSNRD